MSKSFIFTGKLESLESKVYNRHIIVPKEIGEHFIKQKQTRMIFTLNEKLTLRGALMPLNGERYLLMNKSNCNKLGIELGQLLEVEISADLSKYGMEMPPELEFMLSDNNEAERLFENLTPGKQRTLIHIVASVINTDSRINKSNAIVQHLCESKGSIDFKELNQLIKQHNQKNKR